MNTQADDIVRRGKMIESIRGLSVSDQTKEFLIGKVIAQERAGCPKCNGEVFFPALAQTLEVKNSGHLGFWCEKRDCGTAGIETELNWSKKEL